jgi:hypothetical protein
MPEVQFTVLVRNYVEMEPRRIAKDDQGRSARQHGTPVDPGTELRLYDPLSPLIRIFTMGIPTRANY